MTYKLQEMRNWAEDKFLLIIEEWESFRHVKGTENNYAESEQVMDSIVESVSLK